MRCLVLLATIYAATLGTSAGDDCPWLRWCSVYHAEPQWQTFIPAGFLLTVSYVGRPTVDVTDQRISTRGFNWRLVVKRGLRIAEVCTTIPGLTLDCVCEVAMFEALQRNEHATLTLTATAG